MSKLTPKLMIGLGALTIAASAAAIEPGNWEATSQATDVQLPGDVPPQVANMLRDSLQERSFTSTNCITQDQIDYTPENMFRETNGECHYTEFSMSGGTLHGIAQCETGDGTMTMTMDGTYTDTTYMMTMVMNGNLGMGPMSMTYEVNARRIGPCS